ncbi:MAG: tetratricopeptide repeat protein [Sandaracinus sp.]|nr:tetratricopeptide repeat protein [Myxococcales bacterium]MCB9599430.1 tetratricopeptide repeat protein [Sandaracinus sp.]MCB9621813.1 tetratricopeptide repeat protein [Sandaracinus sp.]
MLRWLALVSMLVACGSSPPPPVYRLDAPGRDTAVRLARRLPPGASSCAVARVAELAERRRQLLRPISSFELFAWDPGSPVLAIAQASRRGVDGRESRRILVHVDDVAEARSWLVDGARVSVKWVEEDPCVGDGRECRRWHARSLDPHTIEIGRGAWSGHEGGIDTTRRCVDLAARRADALEVAIERQGLGVVVDDLGTSFGAPGVDHVVVTSPETLGIRWEEDLELPSELPLEVLEVLLETREDSRSSVIALAAHRESRRTGGGVHTWARIRWEDMELARDDAERMREARALAERARLPIPVDQVDATDRALIERQVALRRARMEQSGPEAAREQAEALRTLLERAAAVHPDDAELVGLLVRALLELGEGEEAASWASRMLEASIGDPEHWRQSRRRALAAVGPEALEDALRSDGLARGRDAELAAEVLVAHAARYDAAEAAWLASRTFARVGPRPAPVRSLTLPSTSFFETLWTAMNVEGLARSLHVVLTTDAPMEPRVLGSAEAPIVSWPEGSRGVRVGASTLTSPDGLHGFGRALTMGLPTDARFELVIAVLPFGGDPRHPDAVLRARGKVGAGGVELEAVAATPNVGLRWETLERYLGRPFDGLEARLFPPPDLELELEADADVERLLERAEDEDAALDCRATGLRVRCQTTPDRDVARRAWRRVVEPWIGRPDRTTTRP